MTDEELAVHLAQGAGRLLMTLREGGFPEGAAAGAAGDKVANAFILTALAAWRSADAILSEESVDHPDRLAHERVWIIDPLDGTREYSAGRDDWAVHVGLSVGGAPRLGVVALPAKDRLFCSWERAPEPRPRPRPLMLVSRTRPPPIASAIAEHLGADMIAMGSAGAKVAAVVAGDADLYVHAGGQHEWDNCAPAAVAIGAGLHASRLDGSALVYNQADTLLPDLVIGRPDLAGRVIDYCRR